MNNVDIAGVTPTNTVTLTNKTLTTPVMGGTPASVGQVGRDTTQLAVNVYDNGQVGTIGKVILAGVGSQTFTNSTASDQDYTTLMTFPANTIFTNKRYRVTLNFEAVSGATTVTYQNYLKIGGTKVYTSNQVDPTNSVTRSFSIVLDICGRAAASGSAAITCTPVSPNANSANGNQTDQPVTGFATNGTLTLIAGITFSATTATESLELQAWMVEELN